MNIFKTLIFLTILIGMSACSSSENKNTSSESDQQQNNCNEFLNSDLFQAKEIVLSENGYYHSEELALAIFLYLNEVDADVVDCEIR